MVCLDSNVQDNSLVNKISQSLAVNIFLKTIFSFDLNMLNEETTMVIYIITSQCWGVNNFVTLYVIKFPKIIIT